MQQPPLPIPSTSANLSLSEKKRKKKKVYTPQLLSYFKILFNICEFTPLQPQAKLSATIVHCSVANVFTIQAILIST